MKISESNYNKLIEEIKQCRICESRFGFEPRPITYGAYNSKIVQIGQAPSKSVYGVGLPFSDPSGKRLKGEWYKISEEDFYNTDNFTLTSIGLCYPGKNKSGTDKTPPAICGKTWINRILDNIDNEIYIILGKSAANYFFKGEDFADLVFNDQLINNKKTLVLPHPSPLNIKWFKDNPKFYEERLEEVRDIVHNILDLKKIDSY